MKNISTTNKYVQLLYRKIVNKIFITIAVYFCLFLFPFNNTAQVVLHAPSEDINNELKFAIKIPPITITSFFNRQTELILKKKNPKIISINGCVSVHNKSALTALLDEKLNYFYKDVVIVITSDGSISRMLQLKILF